MPPVGERAIDETVPVHAKFAAPAETGALTKSTLKNPIIIFLTNILPKIINIEQQTIDSKNLIFIGFRKLNISNAEIHNSRPEAPPK